MNDVFYVVCNLLFVIILYLIYSNCPIIIRSANWGGGTNGLPLDLKTILLCIFNEKNASHLRLILMFVPYLHFHELKPLITSVKVRFLDLSLSPQFFYCHVLSRCVYPNGRIFLFNKSVPLIPICN